MMLNFRNLGFFIIYQALDIFLGASEILQRTERLLTIC